MEASDIFLSSAEGVSGVVELSTHAHDLGNRVLSFGGTEAEGEVRLMESGDIFLRPVEVAAELFRNVPDVGKSVFPFASLVPQVVAGSGGLEAEAAM